MGLMSDMKKLDMNPKINEDFFTRTLSGGVITVISSITMFLLFVSELRLLMVPTTHHELVVDTSKAETLQINIDVTFPRMACAAISLDAMDVSGSHHLDVRHNIIKQRLEADGSMHEDEADVAILHKDLPTMDDKKVNNTEGEEVPCGSCYGAEEIEEECCNTCDEVKEAYRRRGWAFSDYNQIVQCHMEDIGNKLRDQEGEGCNIYGILEVNKVAGNFHFAPGKSFKQANMHVHDLMEFGPDAHFDVSHTINKLSFGADFPGVVNPLDGTHRMQEKETGMYQYFVKVVPTVYEHARGSTIETNQFSATEHFRKNAEGNLLPGVFIFYDLSPIKVNIKETSSSFLQFLTSACAIVGGVFTVSGLVDSFVYHGQRVIKKKIEIGKYG